MFQSAPHLFERGDSARFSIKSLGFLFQSAPHLFERGDKAPDVVLVEAVVFQSAPHLFERGDLVVLYDFSRVSRVSIRAPLV